MCTPHLGIELLGTVALNSTQSCCHPTPSECRQRAESVIFMWTSKASIILPLEPRRAQSLVNRCRHKGRGPSHLGCQNLLAMLLSQAPVRVLLSSVTHSSRRNLHLTEKQRKALYCDLKNGEVWALAPEYMLSWKIISTLLYRVLVSRINSGWLFLRHKKLTKYFFLSPSLLPKGASLVAQRLKRLPAMRETWVRSLGREDPLEKEMATHSSILAWRIPWMEEPGGLQSMGLQRVG